MIKNSLRISLIVICLLLNLIIQSLNTISANIKLSAFARTSTSILSSSNLAKEFVYPIGKSDRVTQAKDGDGWYNARDFREVNHLGEDWNAETGGNTDCGLPVRAISNGKIAFAGTNIEGWGNVLIIRHTLSDGQEIESLYGHLKSFSKTSGDVNMREVIGFIGDGGGIYNCHLHLEIRFSNCPSWGEAGAGYSTDARGWTDPSNFIDLRLPKKPSSKRK